MYQVLGICLVVEHAGIVSLVLRYPSSPHDRTPKREKSTTNCTTKPRRKPPPQRQHLFFTLSSRVLAKLFRPKPPLCDRPLTIQIGEHSLFCCHSVLLGANLAASGNNSAVNLMQVSPSTANEGTHSISEVKNDEPVAMFSVVVALAPLEAIPRSLSKKGMGAPFHQYHIVPGKLSKRRDPIRNRRASLCELGIGSEKYDENAILSQNATETKRIPSSPMLSDSHNYTSNKLKEGKEEKEKAPEYQPNSDAHNTILQKVHRSLAKLCRVLVREEQRSLYVSKQTKFLLKIRDDVIFMNQQRPLMLLPPLRANQQQASEPITSAPHRASDAGLHRSNSSSEGITRFYNNQSGNACLATLDLSQQHSFALPEMDSMALTQEDKDRLIEEHRQATLEFMLAANFEEVKSVADSDKEVNESSNQTRNRSNLARELAEVYHALAKRGLQSPPNSAQTVFHTNTSDMSQFTIVYINGHKAVTVERLDVPLPTSNQTKEVYIQDVIPRLLNSKYDPNPQSVRATPQLDAPPTTPQVSSDSSSSSRRYIRPYHTLLFPYVTAEELLIHLKLIAASSITQTGNLNSKGSASNLRDKGVLQNKSKASSTLIGGRNIRNRYPVLAPNRGKGRTSKSSLVHSSLSPMISVLTNIHYFKSLTDVATELSGGSMTLAKVIDVAVRLVDCGVCHVVPTLSLKTRLASPSDFPTSAIPTLRLQFAQQFGTSVPILAVLSVFSSGLTLGEAINRVVNSTEEGDEKDVIGEESRRACQLLLEQVSRAVTSRLDPDQLLQDAYQQGSMLSAITTDVEEMVREELCLMAVWLRARDCLVEVKDFLVALDTQIYPSMQKKNLHVADEEANLTNSHEDKNKRLSAREESWMDSPDIKIDHSGRECSTPPKNPIIDSSIKIKEYCQTFTPEELLFQKLIDAGALDGRYSMAALCWRFELESRQLEAMLDWAIDSRKIQVIPRTHIPSSADDWGAP